MTRVNVILGVYKRHRHSERRLSLRQCKAMTRKRWLQSRKGIGVISWEKVGTYLGDRSVLNLNGGYVYRLRGCWYILKLTKL